MVVASGGRLIPGNTGGRPAPVGWSAGGSQVKNLFSSRSVVAEPGVVSKACRESCCFLFCTQSTITVTSETEKEKENTLLLKDKRLKHKSCVFIFIFTNVCL